MKLSTPQVWIVNNKKSLKKNLGFKTEKTFRTGAMETLFRKGTERLIVSEITKNTSKCL